MSQAWTLRSERRAGDLAWLIAAHARLAQEQGWDATFEAYVAKPMATCILAATPHERLWIAEREGQKMGSIAIVHSDSPGDDAETAQLRWFLVQPEARGQGLGKMLLDQAIAFSREKGYRRIILWTVSQLAAAAHLYRAAGFERVHEVAGKRWGAEVIEEQYSLRFRPRRRT